jgi:ribosomal protein S18 acetylase RimI-like enzyme
MLHDESRYFATRYEDAVHEPDTVWRDWAAEASEGEDKVLLVAEDETGWAGVVGGFRRHDPTEAQLISMWVDPRVRGQGVAQALIRALAAWARDSGARRVFLFVQEVNTPGQALYRRAGFRATGDRAPIGAGRPGFKLLFTASVDELIVE